MNMILFASTFCSTLLSCSCFGACISLSRVVRNLLLLPARQRAACLAAAHATKSSYPRRRQQLLSLLFLFSILLHLHECMSVCVRVCVSACVWGKEEQVHDCWFSVAKHIGYVMQARTRQTCFLENIHTHTHTHAIKHATTRLDAPSCYC